MKKFLAVVLLALCAIAFPEPLLHAQQVPYSNLTRFSNRWDASNFGKWSLRASAGSTSTGAYTLSFPSGGYVTAAGAQSFSPFTTTTHITVGTGSTQETVIPSAVSNCGPSAAGTCQVTATFTYAHGAGTPVISGSGGLDEALNIAGANGGGIVQVSNNTSITDAIIQASTAIFANTQIESFLDGGSPAYYSLAPSVLTALATPATRSATAGATQVISGTATGTFAASAYYVAVAYVDITGQESPASASYNFTATASVALNWASPAASTGAVGWIPYAGLTGTSTMYRITPTAAQCTLTTLETVVPACAIGAAAVTPSPNTTNVLAPGYVVNTYRPNPNGRTVFTYAKRTQVPVCGGIPSNFSPFVASAGGTTGQIEVLGSVNLPAGCLNALGSTLRVSGHITMTAGTSETPVLKVQLGPTLTTGTPTTLCSFANTTALSAAVYTLNFSCSINTNATGASGSAVGGGMGMVALGAGTTAGTVLPELGTATVSNNMLAQDVLYVTYVPTSGTNTAAQLISLTLEMP